MARTLVGRLQLIVQAMGLSEGKKVENTLKSVEAAAKRLSTAAWGQNFQRQMEKMALSAKELDTVRRSWASLQKDMASRGLSAALQKSEISAWKTATLGHFASVRSSMRDTEREARRVARGIQAALRPAYVMLGGYTGVYMAGTLGREAIGASAERQREYFRQRMADIPENERSQIFDRSQALSGRYPSANITDIMEMARTARNTMGSTERGMEVLDRMVQGFVTLQSVKGVEAASAELTGLLRGLDNLGKNANGAVGVQTVNNLIDAFIRASQIEGNDFDVGSMWAFARRSRTGGPALSSEFLATVAPAMIQDMGPDGAGTALNMAYKSFVIGASDGASKVNLARQRAIGIRSGEGGPQGFGNLVDSELFGTNPYAWVKKNLIPALQKTGVDIGNEVQVSQAVAQLSRNSSATGFLTRMITQMDQYERLIALYERGMGTEAADQAGAADPFVAWRGFQQSLRNLSAAVGETVMPVIVPALNSLANTINSFASLVQSGDPRVLGAAGAVGAGVALWGSAKVVTGIWGLITAGTNLNIAAAALQAAAVAQGGGRIGAGAAAAGGATVGGLARWGGRLAAGGMGIWAALAQSLGDTPGGTFDEQVANQRKAREGLQGALGGSSLKRFLFGKAAEPGFSLRDSMSMGTGKYRGGLTGGTDKAPGVFDDMLAGMDKLNTATAAPTVNTASIEAFIAKVNEALAAMQRLASGVAVANSSVSAQIERTYSDYGVEP